MHDPLDDLQILQRRLDLIDAELWIVGPPEMTGRLAGPKTRCASTIEIPFYLQKIPHPNAPAGGQRVLIPEPNLWSPETPYLYEAKLDLGPSRGKAVFSWGFRRLAWGKDGLRVNGAILELNMERREGLDEAEAMVLREKGVKVVELPAVPLNHAAWDVADRVGLLVIGVVGRQLDVVRKLQRHPSALGWIVDPHVRAIDGAGVAGSFRHFLGVRDDGNAPPAWAEFVVRTGGQLASTAGLNSETSQKQD